jgi:hypothetical protein
MADEETSPPAVLPAESRFIGQDSSILLYREQRRVRVHEVTDTEIDALRDSAPALSLTFFGIFVGAAVGFGAAWASETTSDRVHAAFVALFFVSVILSAYFGVSSYRAWRRGNQIVARIRNG